MSESFLPTGWEIVDLEEVAQVDGEMLSEMTDKDLLFRYIDIGSVKPNIISQELDVYRFSDAPSRARRVVATGDILMSTVRPNLQSIAMFKSDEGLHVASTGFAVIRTACAEDNQQFILHSLFSEFVEKQIENLVVGSNYPAINGSDVKKLKILYPPVEQRRKIGDYLSTTDNQITQTQSLIDKYTAIKQGMMADLFSRGIDTTTGQLRPTFEEAPELYKETKLGWVPKEWEVVSMFDIAADERGSTVIGPFGSDLVASDYKKEGVPIVFVRDVKEAGLNWVSNTFISTEKARQLAAHTVRAGDVVATKMGLPPCVSAVYPSKLPTGIITADIIRLRPNLQRALPKWIADTLNSDFVKRQVEEITAGVTRPKVTLRDFRLLKSKYPPLHEQTLILHRLSALENLLDCECEKVQKLVKQKKGLMQDLLTGKVSVPV